MSRLCFLFEYDGSLYRGYQRQSEGLTVQGHFEQTLALVVKQSVCLTAAGRTDRGVHALGQVATADIETRIPVDALLGLLNKRMAPGIRIKRCWWGPDDFHPRYDAVRRVYRYVIIFNNSPSVFLNRYAWQMENNLDFISMRQACKLLEGTHYFVSFCLHPSEAVRLERCLDKVAISPIEDGLVLEFVSRGFLRGQVRHLVGAIVAVGKGRMTLDDVQRLLNATAKTESPVPAPPEGLYLVKIDYSAAQARRFGGAFPES